MRSAAPASRSGATNSPIRIAETERSMLDRLNRRYSGQTQNGGWTGAKFLRAEHVPIGLANHRSRICDFIATGMHSTPWNGWDGPRVEAPVFHGHEVKVSRTDWLSELAKPEKSAPFRRHMHYWWLVAPKEIVRDDLPEQWGLLVPHGRTLRVAVPATLIVDVTPMPSSLVGALMRATATTEGRLQVTN
jgi:hypothetical protein